MALLAPLAHRAAPACTTAAAGKVSRAAAIKWRAPCQQRRRRGPGSVLRRGMCLGLPPWLETASRPASCSRTSHVAPSAAESIELAVGAGAGDAASPSPGSVPWHRCEEASAELTCASCAHTTGTSSSKSVLHMPHTCNPRPHSPWQKCVTSHSRQQNRRSAHNGESPPSCEKAAGAARPSPSASAAPGKRKQTSAPPVPAGRADQARPSAELAAPAVQRHTIEGCRWEARAVFCTRSGRAWTRRS